MSERARGRTRVSKKKRSGSAIAGTSHIVPIETKRTEQEEEEEDEEDGGGEGIVKQLNFLLLVVVLVVC